MVTKEIIFMTGEEEILNIRGMCSMDCVAYSGSHTHHALMLFVQPPTRGLKFNSKFFFFN